jgi:putative ABC transport system permease protein
MTLWVLVAPILVLLAFFVSMVSRQIISLDQNEISVLKSRGATSKQVFILYLGMSVILSTASLAIGIPLGYAACGIIGSSNGFLEFVNRAGLEIKPQAQSFAIAGAAAVAIVIAMAIPAVRASRATIVAHKQKAHVKKRPFWRVLFLDVILLAFALYELYVFSNQKELLAEQAASGASVDPLLFISSSLFMLGAALLFVRLMSHFVRLVYIVGRNIWPPSLYASLLRAIRSAGDEQFIMVFLVLTLATGVFDARVARTVNLNNEHSIRYESGADIVLKEEWQINARHSVAEVSDTGGVTYKEIVWHEPDFSRYQGLAGAESVTKVYTTNQGGVQSVRTQGGNMMIMGIVSDEFGRTAWMRDGLLPSHIYNYLNALAQNPDAVIVSSNFRDKHNMKLGERIMFSAESKNFMGVICGFVDFWPGYDPVFVRREYSGAITLDERYLVVANLAKMQRTQGVLPYEVWIRAKSSDTGFIYDEMENGALSGVLLTKFNDVRTKLVGAKNDPVFQGTNGILTIGFIAILLVCAVGFLIYWILSIRSRELQFGIFRAMGLGMRSVLSMLACEQVLVSGMSIIAGIGVGLLVSEHYVSLIQIGYSTGCRLPLISASDALDTIRLFVVMGIILSSCMAILGVTVKRIRIAQALKLGEE